MSTRISPRADAALVAVTRPDTDPARWRKWSIVVDGDTIATLKSGAFAEFEVSPGRHRVEVLGSRLKSCRRNTVTFDVPLGSFIELRASPRGDLGGSVFANVRPALVAYRIGPGAIDGNRGR